MASKLLQLAEEASNLKFNLLKYQKNKTKQAEINFRLKALEHRLSNYGKRTNLFELIIGDNHFYFTEIDSEDLPYLANFYGNSLGMKPPINFSSRKIELGKPYKNN